MAARRQKKEEPEAWATVQEVAEILDMTARNVQILTKEGVLNRMAPGRYDLKDCVRKYVSWIRPGESTEDINEAKLRKARAEADLAEMDVKERAGELVNAKEIEEVLVSEFSAMKAKLLGIPNKAAAEVLILQTEPEISEALTDFIREALLEISIGRGGDPESKTQPQTSGKDDGRGMGGRGKAPKRGGKRGAGKVAD